MPSEAGKEAVIEPEADALLEKESALHCAVTPSSLTPCPSPERLRRGLHGLNNPLIARTAAQHRG